MLVPFHYYGIYDETDYTKLHIVKGKYAEEELNRTYIGNAYRHELFTNITANMAPVRH